MPVHLYNGLDVLQFYELNWVFLYYYIQHKGWEYIRNKIEIVKCNIYDDNLDVY